MAIVQISRITQRQGLLDDLPQPLAGAELGWAVDQRKLFIGNGSLADGAPVVGNTEILTEFSDVLSFANQYTFKGEAAGYTVQTGLTSGDPVSQSIQSRLDSYAIITDFGVTGDGVTDVTDEINHALYQLYCREINPGVRRSLFFPAGTYKISNTLLIPPYCDLYGEGPESTIINFQVDDWSAAASYEAGVLVQNGGYYFRSLVPVPIGASLPAPPGPPFSNTYWQIETLPSYILRTTDSLQQTGVNIATNNALSPGNLQIRGMKFLTNKINDGLLVEDAEKCYFYAVTINGPQTESSINVSGVQDAVAIRFSSSGSLLAKDCTFSNCSFSGWASAVNTEAEIQAVSFDNCTLDIMYQGFVIGGATPTNGGPTGVRISECNFDNIYAEGIVFENVSLNCSAYNIFYNVGNRFLAYSLPFSSIISMDANNNISVGDMFKRNNEQSEIYPRINLNRAQSIAMSMNVSHVEMYQDAVVQPSYGSSIDLGTYRQIAGVYDNISDIGTPVTLAVVSAYDNQIPGFKFEYLIVRQGFVRTGVITAVTGQIDSGDTGFCYTDDYSENGDTQVSLDLTHDGNISTPKITISYTASNGDGDGTISYTIKHLIP